MGKCDLYVNNGDTPGSPILATNFCNVGGNTGKFRPTSRVVSNNTWYFGALTCDSSMGGSWQRHLDGIVVRLYLQTFVVHQYEKSLRIPGLPGINYAGVSCPRERRLFPP